MCVYVRVYTFFYLYIIMYLYTHIYIIVKHDKLVTISHYLVKEPSCQVAYPPQQSCSGGHRRCNCNFFCCSGGAKPLNCQVGTQGLRVPTTTTTTVM